MRCVQKRLNRSRCRLGLTHVGQRKYVLDGAKVGQIRSPLRGVIRWRCGLLSKFFDQLSGIGTLVANILVLLNERTCGGLMQDGLTALHCAARNGHVSTTAQLLKLNASVTSRTRRGLTALHLAVQGDHTQCVQHLTHATNVDDSTDVCTSLPYTISGHPFLFIKIEIKIKTVHLCNILS